MDLDLSKIEGFEWDKGNFDHIRKHKVSFRECEEIFMNKPLLLSKDKSHSEIEERFQALGVTNNRKLIFLAFTIRNNRIRVISARDQNRKERQKLEQIGGENNE